MTLIDTHAHLDYSDFDPDRAQVLSGASAVGVHEIISIGTNLDSSAKAVELASHFPNIWAAVGVHPTEAHTVNENFIDRLRELASSPRVVAIGEIGLDYHTLPSTQKENKPQDVFAATVSVDPNTLTTQIADDDYKNQQAIIFRQQLDLAVELNLNAVIHQRDSWDDTIEILNDYTGNLRCVFHCFGGTVEQAQQLFSMGHIVSFTGIVTFKNAKDVQKTAAAVPLGHFLVETDCPYLAPVPHRGKRCEPAYVRLVAEQIAKLRNSTVEEIAEATTTTARRFFNFGRATAHGERSGAI
jgi:TatD DNase family protein